MNRRMWSALLVLCFVVAGVVGFVPAQPAVATATWPVKVQSNVRSIVPTSHEDDDTLLFAGCGGTANGYSNGRISNQSGPSYEYPLAGSGFSCDQSADSTVIGGDGTVYGAFHREEAGNFIWSFAAVKNSRVKWQTDLSWTDACDPGASPWNTYAGSSIESVSIAANGDVYMLVYPTASYCKVLLLGLDGDTGATVLRANMGNAYGGGSGTRPRVWTYDDFVIAVDRSGLKHVYDYSGVEDTGEQYQFPTVGNVVANKDGRVFMEANCGDLHYSDIGGANGYLARNVCVSGGPWETFFPGPDGKLASYAPDGTFYLRDLAATPETIEIFPSVSHSGAGYVPLYSQGVTSVQVDTEGNFLRTSTMSKDANQTISGVFIDYIDHDTLVAPSTLLSLEGDGSGTNRPSTLGRTPGLEGGYLYSAIQHGHTASQPLPDVFIHKTDVSSAGFGTPVPQGPGFANYDSQKLEYVAMGDSFSSGEGVEPFNPSTDKGPVSIWDETIENRCHRSIADAYPSLLMNASSSNLDLTDFVACSGARTSNVLTSKGGSGGWGEPAQVDALSASTDVVTITIGGNDVKFADFAKRCLSPVNTVFLNEVCDEHTDIYDEVVGLILDELPAKLVSVYDAILIKAPNAEIYVGGYPLISPYKSISDPFDNQCGGLYDEYPNTWGDARAAYEVTNLLNDTIKDAVEYTNINRERVRLHFVDMSTGAFLGHDACSDESYFNGIDIVNPEYSIHPNYDGQIAYKDMFAEAIG